MLFIFSYVQQRWKQFPFLLSVSLSFSYMILTIRRIIFLIQSSLIILSINLVLIGFLCLNTSLKNRYLWTTIIQSINLNSPFIAYFSKCYLITNYSWNITSKQISPTERSLEYVSILLRIKFFQTTKSLITLLPKTIYLCFKPPILTAVTSGQLITKMLISFTLKNDLYVFLWEI